ncbi:MAG: FtsQ-type POTRA domain-containing protein [Acidimicrobiia bacterium]|nr:FtsQ-type POTRA domain-containing protein [Acidimicrobiia bacterium]
MTSRLTDVTTRRPLAPVRRAKAAWLGVAVMLVMLAGAVALHSPWLSVREIEIAGADRVDAARLLDEAGIGTGAIMIWLDTGTVEAAIASDPWAAVVHAGREWPSRLVVEVQERIPAMWLEGPEGWMLVSTDGMVLEVADEAGSGLLTVALGLRTVPTGIRPQDPLWDELLALSSALAGPLASNSRLVADGSEVWLETPGHLVRFGHPIDLADKARVAQVMLDDGLPDGATLDVGAPRRPAVVPATTDDILQGEVEGGDGGDSGPAVEGEGEGA